MYNMFWDYAHLMDECITTYSPNNIKKVLLLFKKKGVKFYFWANIVNAQKPIEWFIPLYEKGYFNPINNPKPIKLENKADSYIISTWPVLPFIEAVSKENSNNPKKEVTSVLVNIVDSIIDYKVETKDINDRTIWFILKIISLLPLGTITEKHIEYTRYALLNPWDTTLIPNEIGRSLIPRLIKHRDSDLLLKLLDIILDYKKPSENNYMNYDYLMNEYWLDEAMTNNVKSISELCGFKAVDICLTKIRNIYKENPDEFRYLADLKQGQYDSYRYKIVQYTCELIDIINPDNIRNEIEALINDDNPLLKRIAFYAIKEHYKELKHIFWGMCENPLENEDTEREVFLLIKKNIDQLDDNQIQTILDWIKSLKSKELNEEFKHDEEKYNGRIKRDWLSALTPTKNTSVLQYDEELKAISPEDPHHQFLHYWTSFFAGMPSSPISKEFFSDSQLNDIIQKINEIDDTIDSLKKRALILQLRQSIIEQSDKYFTDYMPLLKLKYEYITEVINASIELWRTKKQVNIANVFNFIDHLIGENGILNKTGVVNDDNSKDTIIYSIASLISRGTKNDDTPFEDSLLPMAEKILLKIYIKTNSSIPLGSQIRTYYNLTNSTKMEILASLIHLSLRYARDEKNDENHRWHPDIKDLFSDIVNEGEEYLDSDIIFGQYIPNIFWLDLSWLQDNLNNILPMENSDKWRASFAGYITHNYNVYKQTFLLLKQHGHYNRAIKDGFNDDEHVNGALLQHVLLAYSEGWDDIKQKGSLINSLIENKNVKQLHAFIDIVWRSKGHIDKKKVIVLWNKISKKLKKETSAEYVNIRANLASWIVYVDNIGSGTLFNNIMFSAKHYNQYTYHGEFIKALKRLVQKEPLAVSKIYIKIIKHGNYPDFREEDVIEVVRTLYLKKQRKAADYICNKYGENGKYFLRNTYMKNQPKREKT